METVTIQVELRGKLWDVTCYMAPPDKSVGIFSWSLDDYEFKDKDHPTDLTGNEEEHIDSIAFDALAECDVGGDTEYHGMDAD